MIDNFIIEFDTAIRTIFGHAATTRPMPGDTIPEAQLSESERRHAAALMRVNHVGEVCAQALYQGQALTCRNPATSQALRHAAQEETEHLNWTERRIDELGGRKSLLNPLWYVGSLAMGVTAGRLGDDWNLGFLVETERQVEAHLTDHLSTLPANDQRSRAVVEQMRRDEINHGDTALALGSRELPAPVKTLMTAMAKVMTTVAYRI